MKRIMPMLCAVSLIATSCLSMRTINGDGNVETKQINITAYDEIETMGGSMNVQYAQTPDSGATLTVSTDRNIFDMYEMKVKDRKLIIRPRDEFRNVTFRPTTFTVTTNSATLKAVDVAGHIDFNVVSPLKAEELSFDLAGSGTINLNDTVAAGKLDVDLAGSATLNSFWLTGNQLNGDIAGSGILNLKGEMENASFDIAGSGDVRAFDLNVAKMSCDIAGSGDIKISVSKSIRASIAGSGRIEYKGNPTDISKDVSGSGSIVKIED